MNPLVAKCLVVASVLAADGVLTDEERAFLHSVMASLGLSEADQAHVQASLKDAAATAAAEAIVKRMTSDERQAILESLVDAASADGKLAASEHAAIKRLAATLGLA